MIAFLSDLGASAVGAFGRILLALLVGFAGRALIRAVMKALPGSPLFRRADGAVKTFTLSVVHIALWALLVIAIVTILGVPMASVAALITSAGIAVGLGFQGALANLAGGIMLIIFKPFKLGDYVETSGVTGTAEEINLFYTVLTTADNKRVTIPNGSLMNANITNYSANDRRRVELTFSCARSENPADIQEIMRKAMSEDARVLTEPEAPFAGISGSDHESYQFLARAWCKTEDYLDVYYALSQKITEALAEAGVKSPAVRVVS